MSQTIIVTYDSSPTRVIDLPSDFLAGVDVDSLIKLIVKREMDLPDEDKFFDLEATISLDADSNVIVTLHFTPAETALPAGTWPGALRVWKDGDDSHEPDDVEAVNLEVEEAIDLP
jgi:hypothetical protein